MHLSPSAPGPVGQPREFVFAALGTSFSLVQPILDADKTAVGSREFYDDEYFDRFFAGVKPILEKRLSDSIGAVAAVIRDAWVEAGRPALPVTVITSPRRVRR